MINFLRVFMVVGSLVTIATVDRASSATFQVLHEFGGSFDGANPSSGLVFGQDGSLYGETRYGSGEGAGSVYKIAPDGTETIIFNFPEYGAQGSFPWQGLTFDTAGNLIGATEYGGSGGGGIVFRITLAGSETILHAFGGKSEGAYPNGVVLDLDGNIYGSTVEGGAQNCGTLYELTPSATFTTLHYFDGSTQGCYPESVISLEENAIFGTTFYLGQLGGGTLFTAQVGAFDVLQRFGNYAAGAARHTGSTPVGALTFDTEGNIYGATFGGGAFGGGAIYRVAPDGTEAILHSFAAPENDVSRGSEPAAGLTFDSAGNLYGTTTLGGLFNFGIVFRLAPNGKFTVLHSFGGARDGSGAASTLCFGTDGSLYGTTSMGGHYNKGTAFRLTP